MHEKDLKSILLILASAIMLGLTRLPYAFDMFVFVAFVPLFYYFTRANKESKFFLHGVLFSTTYLLISIHWISLVTFGGFIGILVLFGIIFGVLFWYISVGGINRFIFTWLTFEFITNFTEFSFPWFSIGYGLKNSLSLLQFLDIGGLPLISLLILYINYLLFNGLLLKEFNTGSSGEQERINPFRTDWKNKYIISAFIILFVWYCFGNMKMYFVQKNTIQNDFTIALIQGNIRQELKFEDDMLESTFEIYESLSRQVASTQNPDLIVFPESALPTYLYLWRENYFRLMELVMEIKKPIFTGFLGLEQGEKYKGQTYPFFYYNTSNLFTPYDNNHTNYNKNKLVPFGERFPFLHIFPILWKLDFGQANFERGTDTVIYKVTNNSDTASFTFAPLICFEIAFPLYTRNIAYKNKHDFWVNITNDAWFEKSIGTHQHAVMATFRTIENRKPIFRAANTGFTLYTTPDGKIHQKTQLFETTFVTAQLSSYNKSTHFVRWGYLLPYAFIAIFTFQIIRRYIKL